MKLVGLYLTTLVTFLVIDGIWLGLISRKMYATQIGHLMTENIRWGAAVVFYLLFVGGLIYLAILPGLSEHSLRQALIRGMVFGFLSYATYDLTNLATLKGWPIMVTVIDMIWGAVLSGIVVMVGYSMALKWW